jgi:hypothetical protein
MTYKVCYIRHNVKRKRLFTWLPLTNWGGVGGVIIEGRPVPKPGQMPIPNIRMIRDKYIQAVGMRLIAGRTFDPTRWREHATRRADQPNRRKKFWPGENPIGTRFQRDNEPPQPWITVVGIVGDVRQAGLDLPPRPEIYLPYQQWDYFWPKYIAVRTTGNPMAIGECSARANLGRRQRPTRHRRHAARTNAQRLPRPKKEF